ncbi:MAG: NUDIX hydrolase [Vicinamibacterales bacterium]
MTDPMDVVRALFRAANDGDAAAAARLYDERCTVEGGMGGGDVAGQAEPDVVGRAAVEAAWRRLVARGPGGLPGQRRFDVGRIAGIETGWGWVRADWVAAFGEVASGAGPAAEGPPAYRRGYSHFWIEHGLIRRQRDVARAVADLEAARAPDTGGRQYPDRPVVGVGAVVRSDAGEVLLVRRRHEPLAGQWSLPGGLLEVGETLEAGVAREVLEETGLVVQVGDEIEVFDRILLDDAGRPRFHFVLVDYLCRPVGGVLAAGSDVSDAAFVLPEALADLGVAAKARDVVARALARAGAAAPSSAGQPPAAD